MYYLCLNISLLFDLSTIQKYAWLLFGPFCWFLLILTDQTNYPARDSRFSWLVRSICWLLLDSSRNSFPELSYRVYICETVLTINQFRFSELFLSLHTGLEIYQSLIKCPNPTLPPLTHYPFPSEPRIPVCASPHPRQKPS